MTPAKTEPRRLGLLRALGMVVALAAPVFAPDALFKFLQPGYAVVLSPLAVAAAMLLAALIVLARSRAAGRAFIALVFVLQATQLAHHRYFGVFYSAFDIELLTKELRDTWLATIDLLPLLAPPLLISGACALLALLSFDALSARVVPVRRGWLQRTALAAAVLVLAIPFVQAVGSSTSQRFQPNMMQLSVKNGLYSSAYFLGRRLRVALGKSREFPVYEAYRVGELETADEVRAKPRNVVLLMGESTSYLHMGLFGYARDTTPDLDPYAQDPAFIGIRALSSSVSTRSSLTLFYNLIYEPDNALSIRESEHSLYRLAKRHGFVTTYITTQQNPGGLSYAFSQGDIDHWRDTRDMGDMPGEHDDRLLKALQALGLDYGKPNFITLHMRSAHSPYVENYPRGQARFPDEGVGAHERQVNSYDNSILYTQRVIADIYRALKRLERPFYIFYIPDHGEVLGKDARYGHNTLNLDDAMVPFLFYGIGVPQAETDALRARLGCLTNHYLVGQEIARALGFVIENPNERADEYFLNGIDAFGEAGFLRYRLSEQRAQLCRRAP